MVKQLLERVALGLESREVPYMIIGGQAVLVYGEPRLTQGVDVTLGGRTGAVGEDSGLGVCVGLGGACRPAPG